VQHGSAPVDAKVDIDPELKAVLKHPKAQQASQSQHTLALLCRKLKLFDNWLRVHSSLQHTAQERILQGARGGEQGGRPGWMGRQLVTMKNCRAA
jgi:hypothetical protein